MRKLKARVSTQSRHIPSNAIADLGLQRFRNQIVRDKHPELLLQLNGLRDKVLRFPRKLDRVSDIPIYLTKGDLCVCLRRTNTWLQQLRCIIQGHDATGFGLEITANQKSPFS